MVACNTASAAALYHLREHFDLPIVGMEPAVKPAVERTRSRQIGVIATRATFQGELFARLVERFARGATLHTQACPGLVERVEVVLLDDPETKALIKEYLGPMLGAGIDSLVLGCTHYPFLLPAIRRIVGPSVDVIDPAPAVARQTERVLARLAIGHAQWGRELPTEVCVGPPEISGGVSFFTSGDPAHFHVQVGRLVNIPGQVRGSDGTKARWSSMYESCSALTRPGPVGSRV